MLQQLKEELVAVLSQHFDIDKDGIQITIGEGNRRNRLIADIPLMTPGRVRSRQQKV
jgi:septum formation topological specificity factor MinE